MPSPPDSRQDVEYVPTYHSELSPGHIDFALLLAGIEPPRRAGMRYLELGFGQGISASIHAAASPGEYWGTDFNPVQAAHARGLVQVAGADAKFFDDSFADFAARDDLPDFDYIILHGIWSWVSDENRRVLVGILRDRLKVGGVVYAGYNTLPGWAPFFPVRALLRERAVAVGMDGAIAEAAKLAATGAKYLAATPWLAKRLGTLQGHNRDYLAHDYLCEDWAPCYFAEIADMFAGAGLSHAGPALAIDRLDLQLSADQIAFLGDVAPERRETVRDYLTNRLFRQDLFCREARRLGPDAQTERLRNVAVMLLKDRKTFAFDVPWRAGVLNLDRGAHSPLLDLLAVDGGAPQRIGVLADSPALKRLPPGELLRMVATLLGIGAIGLVRDEAEVELASGPCRRLNEVLVDRAAYLSSPVLGAGVAVSDAERLAIAGGDLGAIDKHRASLLRRLMVA